MANYDDLKLEFVSNIKGTTLDEVLFVLLIVPVIKYFENVFLKKN